MAFVAKSFLPTSNAHCITSGSQEGDDPMKTGRGYGDADRIGFRSLIVACLLIGAAAPLVAQPACTTGASVDQWKCWEQTLTIPGLGANPYRDYIIQVTFLHSIAGTTNQDVFWDTGSTFKIHAAFPPGTVTWGGLTCQTARTGGPSCPSMPATSGALTVNALTTGTNKLYDKGFLRQDTFYGYSALYYWDFSEQFYWNGDTAWSAPGFEASQQSNRWSSYIADRSGKNVNVTLVAPAATYQPFLPNSGPFTQLTGCVDTNPIPNTCSIPSSAYWNRFDALIGTANRSGIVPVIAGLLDPLDTAGSGQYPCQADAVGFSRYLAARMAGLGVMLSPGFDDNRNSTTRCGQTLTSVMNAIGSAVKDWPTPASWRVVMGNHLAGGATCDDYQAFSPSLWMSLFLFQSGHGGGSNSAGNCPQKLTGESAVAAAMRRSWQIPWTLKDAGPPLRPAYNAEGPYDDICLQTPGCIDNVGFSSANNYSNYVDVRYHVRQAAFESVFSTAYGATNGVTELGQWTFGDGTTAATYNQALNGAAVTDLKSLFDNFKAQAYAMFSCRGWITNNGNDTDVTGNTAGNFKKACSSNGSSSVLAYMPALPTTGAVDRTIRISTSDLPGLSCTANGWTAKWFHAQNNVPANANISCSGANPLSVTKPPDSECPTGPTYDNQACDWVLQFQKTGSASIASQASPSGQTLDVWADLSSGDGTSAIYAQLAGPPGSAPAAAPVLVSPPGLAFQQFPRVTRVRNGYLVVWHADGHDSSLLDVFAQRLDQQGQPVGGRIRVNTTSEGDQRDPVVDSSPLGDSVVVWTSHGQDGDLGGMYGRLLDSSGTPLTGDFRINDVTVGHQEMPQVAYLPGGGFVAAWQTRAMDANPGALSFKVFSAAGSAATPEVRVPGQVGVAVAPRLIDVMPTAAGGLRLRWRLIRPYGGSRALLQQDFNAAGQPLGPATPLR